MVKQRPSELILGLSCLSKYLLADIKGIVVELYTDLSVRVDPRFSLPGYPLKLKVNGVAGFFRVLVIAVSHRFLRLVELSEMVDS